FFFMLSTDTTYIHSWGSILVQDVILPIYGKKVSQRVHLLLLRGALLFVAAFALCFSWLYQQSEYINMFQMLTGVIFSAGAGCAIIGGLYWRRATRAGAWCGTAVGFLLALCSIVLLDMRGWHFVRGVLLGLFPENNLLLVSVDKCPVNGAYLSLAAVLSAQLAFVTVSLLTCRTPFNLDKMLHRGIYSDGETTQQTSTSIPWYKRLFLGFDSEFTRRDKIVAISVSCWVFFWGGAFVIITLWNIGGYLLPDSILKMWPAHWWFNYFLFYLGAHVVLAPFTAIWMTWGGLRDLKHMFRLLRDAAHSTDDGYIES
ncbi:MAG: hypothetical protein PHS41_13105, partial [Victivallaceae bacterium]|nr:hypothetical protein [Victivallaceae bacterium]